MSSKAGWKGVKHYVLVYLGQPGLTPTLEASWLGGCAMNHG